jgi:2-C-methyl-D-erythritol 4-phosphate cytidylyltransferase
MSEIKIYAIIVAGGSGNRMGHAVPKQFLLLNGKPILSHSVEAFLNAYQDIHVILVLPAEHLQRGQYIIDQMDKLQKERVAITTGGHTRFDSVKKGLSLVKGESIIFVHDAVRCLVTASLIHRCYEQASKTGSAIPAIPSKDSVRLVTDNGSIPYERNKVMLIQTPQTFQSKILIPAFERDNHESFTDEATVVEAGGGKIELIEGEKDNIKITTPLDLIIAESLLRNMQEY